jgi:hypothetical protein
MEGGEIVMERAVMEEDDSLTLLLKYKVLLYLLKMESRR